MLCNIGLFERIYNVNLMGYFRLWSSFVRVFWLSRAVVLNVWRVMILISLGREEALAVAGAIANRIILIINQVFELEGHCVKVGCSVGCSLWRDAGRDYKEIVNQADEALHSAKRAGKNQVKIR